MDFSDPANITELDFADVSDVGASAQSVAVNNGIVAIAISNNDETGNGFIAFSDTLGNETPVVVEVGVLPDMITFTPDGTKLLVANEGILLQKFWNLFWCGWFRMSPWEDLRSVLRVAK